MHSLRWHYHVRHCRDTSKTKKTEVPTVSSRGQTTGLRRSDLVSSALTSLHWLRIPFKVAVLTYKVLHGCAPSYLGWFVRVSDLPSRRALCSAKTSRLIQPQSVGDRAFPVAGPQVWNSLPPEVTSAPSLDTFRRSLKTHLFTVSYSNTQLS